MAGFEFAGELLFAGEDCEIFRGEELGIFVEHGVADNGFVFIGAEDDADCGIVVGSAFDVIEHADIHVHLADVLVAELVDLEVDQHEALEQVVVENEVNVEMGSFRADAELAPDEGEAPAEFEEEVLQVIDEGRFDVALVSFRVLGQVEKFENVGVLEDTFWSGRCRGEQG